MTAIRSIDLVIPVFNEEATLPTLFERLDKDLATLAIPWRAIFVDDGSRDGSWRLIEQATRRDPRCTAIRLARNFGQHAAVFAGFSRCSADAVVTLDADLQNPPGEIPRLVAALDAGADVVGGWREQRHDTPFRRLASRGMNRLISRATGVALRDYGCMLRAYRIEIVRMMSESGEISSFIPALGALLHRSRDGDPGRARRAAGGEVALLGVRLVRPAARPPDRLLDVLAARAVGLRHRDGGARRGARRADRGLRIALGSEWAAQGVFTLFAALFVFVGAQFVALGILGEYLGRVYDQVRQRPRYVVRTELGAPAAGPAARAVGSR
jgi:undecaprenyl-phosphate 4-deoxy-4-formamido-L-arabinose transferase